ncbi:MAG: FkbM family methyltransferase [bacterium]
MQFLASALENSWHIIRSGSPFGKWNVLRTYWKIKAMHAFAFKLLRIRPTQTTIFGHMIHFYHLPTFIGLFEEIIIKNEYATPLNTTKRTILDCGANIGIASLYFYMCNPEAQITSFEPSSINFKILSKNLPFPDRVVLVNKAVGKESGQRSFYFDANNVNMGMSSLLKERQKKVSAVETVECTPLSHYITSEIDLLKLDVEGAEQEVLEEIVESGKIKMIREMMVEYHHHILYEDTLSKFLLILEKNGFGYHIKKLGSGSGTIPVFQDILLYIYRKDILPHTTYDDSARI